MNIIDLSEGIKTVGSTYHEGKLYINVGISFYCTYLHCALVTNRATLLAQCQTMKTSSTERAVQESHAQPYRNLYTATGGTRLENYQLSCTLETTGMNYHKNKAVLRREDITRLQGMTSELTEF